MLNARTHCGRLSRSILMGDEGLELRTVSKWKITDIVIGDAESDALTVDDPQLQLLIEHWPTLSKAVQQQIMLLVG